jgi:quercetin 2,3-dioxygenase
VVDTALVGVDIALRAGTVEVPLDPAFEHAVLAVGGQAEVAGTPLRPGPLLYLGTGRDSVRLGSAGGAHLILLGGEPFDEDLVMWWNFVARSHDEIVGDRAEWEARGDRFGTVVGHGTDRIPAPPLPGGRLRPRPRPTG